MTLFSRFYRGQIAIILNLALPSLSAALLLGVDATSAYLNRIQLQRSVDAAVVVGASYLPLNPSLAVSAAQSYAHLNGIKAGEIVSTRISSNKATITMSVRRAASCYFARALGLTMASVSATATARVAPAAARNRGSAIRIHFGQSASVSDCGGSETSAGLKRVRARQNELIGASKYATTHLSAYRAPLKTKESKLARIIAC